MKKSIFKLLTICISCVISFLCSFNFVYAESFTYNFSQDYIDTYTNIINDIDFNLFSDYSSYFLNKSTFICYSVLPKTNGILYIYGGLHSFSGDDLLSDYYIAYDSNKHTFTFNDSISNLSLLDGFNTGFWVVGVSSDVPLSFSFVSESQKNVLFYDSKLFNDKLLEVSPIPSPDPTPTPTPTPIPTPIPTPNPNDIKYKFNSYVSSSDSYVYGGGLGSNNLRLDSGSINGLSMSLQASNLTFDAVSTNYSLINGNKDKIFYVDKWKLAMNPNALLSQGGSANLTGRNITGGFTFRNQQIEHNYYINNVITFDKSVDGILSYTENGNKKSVYLVNNNKYEFTSLYEMQDIDVSQLSYSTGEKVDFSQDSNFYKDKTGTADKLENNNSKLDTSVKDYTSMEDSYINDMKNNFTSVDTNADLLKQNGFLNSAKWVSSQFNNLVDVKTSDGSQPFKLMLFFSLILGIALIMLGKISR